MALRDLVLTIRTFGTIWHIIAMFFLASNASCKSWQRYSFYSVGLAQLYFAIICLSIILLLKSSIWRFCFKPLTSTVHILLSTFFFWILLLFNSLGCIGPQPRLSSRYSVDYKDQFGLWSFITNISRWYFLETRTYYTKHPCPILSRTFPKNTVGRVEYHWTFFPKSWKDKVRPSRECSRACPCFVIVCVPDWSGIWAHVSVQRCTACKLL